MSGVEIPEGKGATIRITFRDARKGVRELVVGDVELANALARVAEGDANRRPFSFRDFHAGHVGNEHGLASECASFELGNADSLTEQNYAAARACRIFHERSRLRSASSSGSK